LMAHRAIRGESSFAMRLRGIVSHVSDWLSELPANWPAEGGNGRRVEPSV